MRIKKMKYILNITVFSFVVLFHNIVVFAHGAGG